MSDVVERIKKFADYAKLLSGDEKGESQVFCDRLFQAFAHAGYKEAGASLEYRIKKKDTKGTSFADLVWKPRLLIEMKKRGENLYIHYKQAFDYWIHAVPYRPRYVILCNFDEFWVYVFDKQIDQPVDIIPIEELSLRYAALNFLFPDNPEPIFGNDREAVSRDAADKIAQLFNSLIARKIPREQAQRFILQMVVAMFSEDIDLLPSNTVYRIVGDCLHKGQKSYDLFMGLFQQMNNPEPSPGGRFKNIPYFNGGLFSYIEPIDLSTEELQLIGGEEGASTKDWSKVNPSIFGTLFQQSMDAEARHAHGAHFTSEADILRIVNPTIVRPWQERIDKASTIKELINLRRDMLKFRILDPACGSGNFLYLSYRELVRLDIHLMTRFRAEFSAAKYQKYIQSVSLIGPRQFYGIDRDSFAVELAKVTLMLAKKLALNEALEALDREQYELPFLQALPLDNLDPNFICGDALFTDWPDVDAIIGNPPYQSKNKIQQELGPAYVNKIRDKYPDIDGRADYCVYWYRRAHDHLKPSQRAGLVGTNTIRQNYSRTGGLDYIVGTGGTITEAVSTMKWSGEAVVHVSVVNWIKGEQVGKKRLFIQEDDNDPSQGWRYKELDKIGPSLSFDIDVTNAGSIKANAAKGGCFQGQTHGHEGFLLTIKEALAEMSADPRNVEILFPYLIADELIGRSDSLPMRYVIDFNSLSQIDARSYNSLFSRIKDVVLQDRKDAADDEEERNKAAIKIKLNARVNHHHRNFLNKWWQLSYSREEMITAIQPLKRYIVCGRVTRRPIFEFVDSGIRPNDALMVFPYEDDYSFGILQSSLHWIWFINRCSTLKGDPRYTSNTVFDSFPWPQSPNISVIGKVAKAAEDLRHLRRELMIKLNLSLRELYRSIEDPGSHPLKEAQNNLDRMILAAYGVSAPLNPLEILLRLNEEVIAAESIGKPIIGPGLPPYVKEHGKYISLDCIRMK